MHCRKKAKGEPTVMRKWWLRAHDPPALEAASALGAPTASGEATSSITRLRRALTPSPHGGDFAGVKLALAQDSTGTGLQQKKKMLGSAGGAPAALTYWMLSVVQGSMQRLCVAKQHDEYGYWHRRCCE